MIKFNGREYKWWIVRNSHLCQFCIQRDGITAVRADLNHPARLGSQALNLRRGKGQYTKGYWNTMFQLFKKHVNQYHPEVKIMHFYKEAEK